MFNLPFLLGTGQRKAHRERKAHRGVTEYDLPDYSIHSGMEKLLPSLLHRVQSKISYHTQRAFTDSFCRAHHFEGLEDRDASSVQPALHNSHTQVTYT